MSDYQTLLLAVDGGVATVTLNRPEQRNAWSVGMAQEQNRMLAALDRDDSVRAIVLTGAGTAFCVGADLPDDDAFAEPEGEQFHDPMHWRSLVAPWSLRKPVVAAINGHAVGVGITYALMCDRRFVAEDAKIAFSFVRRGVLPELASHAILPRLVGIDAAADLLLSGRTISGGEAARLGLAAKALPADQVLNAALDWAREVARYTAPVSVALSKRLLWEGLAASPLAVARKEHELLPWVCSQPDAVEGVRSFLEKRDPRFSLSPTRDLIDWP
jgi:enoyl-CoA hydratase/carnithine racemase